MYVCTVPLNLNLTTHACITTRVDIFHKLIEIVPACARERNT